MTSLQSNFKILINNCYQLQTKVCLQIFAEDRGSDGDKPEPTPSPPTDSPVEYKESRSIIKCTVTLNGNFKFIIGKYPSINDLYFNFNFV